MPWIVCTLRRSRLVPRHPLLCRDLPMQPPSLSTASFTAAPSPSTLPRPAMAFVPYLPSALPPASLPALSRAPLRPRARQTPTPFCFAQMSAGAETARQQTFASAWQELADHMRATNETPPLSDWHHVLDVCVRTNEGPEIGIWLLNMMRDLGLRPTAGSYERVLTLCNDKNDRAAAFHLVELMFKDKVLLGDVLLPDGMEEMLRTILPPEAFE